MSSRLESIDAIVGDTVTFECQLNKPNLKVKWLKDNKPLVVNDRIQSSVDAENSAIHLLTIKTIEKKDAASYTCVIDQPASKKCSATLNVQAIKVQLVEPLANVTIGENENLILKFTLSHELKQIPVQWKFNNQPIAADHERIQIEQDGKTYFLSIKQVKLTEKGSYSAEIPLHKIETSSRVDVQPEEIRILQPLHLIPDAEHSENRRLEIQLSKPVAGGIRLLKDGVQPSRKIPVEDLNNGVYRFLLENVTPTDSGLYEVRLSPDLSSSLQVDIELKSTDDELDFLQGLPDQLEINENEPLHLQARLSRPANDVVWLRNGQPIPTSIQTDSQPDGLVTLDIPRAQLSDDAGKYTLRLPNGKQSSIQVTIVKKKPGKEKNELIEPLHIVLEDKVDQLKLNSKVILRCRTSQPVKEVQWFKGSRKVNTRRAQIVSTENSTQHDLVFSKLEFDDLGTYEIQLDTDLQSSIDLTIGQELSPIQCQGEPIEGGTIVLMCQSTLPPKQVQWSPIADRKRYDQSEELKLKIKNLNVEQDTQLFTIDVDGVQQTYQLTVQVLPWKFQGTIELNPKLPKEDENVTCTVTMNKPVKDNQTVQWYLNDEPIPSDERYQLSFDGPRAILTIKKIRPEDAGLLECRLSTLPDEKLSTELKVKEKPLTILKPLTANKDKPMEGDDLLLSCQFSRKPKTLELFKDGKPVDVERELNDANATFTIRLPKCQSSDKGKYTVIADGVETSYTLRLAPNPIKFVKPLKWDNESPYEGETVQATFTLSRLPDKPIQWLKGKINLPAKSTAKYEYSQLDCTFTLTIPSIELSDADTYSVKLPDDTQSSARLKVLETPVKVLVPLTLEPAEPIVGGEFTLSITLSRDVKSSFKWLKTGKELSSKRDARIKIESEPDVERHGQRYLITIRDAKADDEGAYRFEAEPNNISESKLVKLTEPKIVIVQCDEIVTGKLGSPVTLSCEVNLPQGQVVWYHEGIKLTASDATPSRSSGLSVKNTDVGRTLTLTGLKKDQLGSYSVKTKDDKREIQVKLASDDDQLKVLEHPGKVLDLDQGEALILSIVTNRKCSIEFLKNNQRLKTTETFDAAKSRYTVTYQLDQVELNDAGIVRSRVVDTQFEYQTEVLVHDPYQRQKTDVLDSELPLLFIKKLEDQKVNEGEPVRLECQFNRTPKSTPSWTRNGVEFFSGENLTITLDDTRLELVIPRTTINDHAEYTLTVENLRGHAFVDVVSRRISSFSKRQSSCFS